MSVIEAPRGRAQLHWDVTDGDRLKSLPAWARSPRAGPEGYWHIPRSAAVYPDVLDGVRRICVHAWCGQAIHITDRRTCFTNRTPPDRLCGTCVGRHAGYNRNGGTIFTPRDHFFSLPRWCPGRSQKEWRSGSRPVCFACGGKPRYHYDMCGAREGKHRPEPALLDHFRPCLQHGWTRMEDDIVHGEQVLRCQYWRCDTVIYPRGEPWT